MFPRTFYKSISQRRNLFRLPQSITNRSLSDKPPVENIEATSETKSSQIAQLLESAATYNPTEETGWATSAYPEGTPLNVQDRQADRTGINPTDTSIILFPGQGVLKVGDVKQYLRFPDAKYLFEIANEALGYDLLKICLDGPQKTLDRTEYNQPAVVVTALAALEKLKEERPRAIESCAAVAGYSVGEITALIFSGAMSFEAGIRLVGIRATAMQNASNMTPQGMLAVNYKPEARMSDICKKAQTWAMDNGATTPECRIAIYVHMDKKIVAGSEEALKYIEANANKLGLRSTKRLAVSGAFHTALMTPALDIFKKALKTIELEEPGVAVHSNVDGKRYRNVQQIARYLPKQIVLPVKWEQTMHNFYIRKPGTEFPRTFDIASRGVLKGILKCVNAKAWNSCIVV